jgi:phage shock protein C
MERTLLITLTGHPEPYRLDEAAYARLSGYLDRAARRLQADPDREEIVGDLERSVGDRLSARGGGADRMVTAAEIDAILEDIGAVGTGSGADRWGEPEAPPVKRKLTRLKEGQEIAGVCTGIAGYTEIRVDWVRTVVVLAAVFTGGLFMLVYIALAVLLPVVPSAPVRS